MTAPDKYPETLTEVQLAHAKAYFECEESESRAANQLGVSRAALRTTLWLTHKKGVNFAPDNFSPVAPVGWECTKSTVHHKNGGVIQQWDRVAPMLSTEELAKFLSERIPISSLTLPPVSNCNKNLMLEWPVFDAHHGMLAWAKETGNDYDHKISRHLQVSAGKILFASFGPVKRAVIILGGDNQTADNRSGSTEKSHNIVDTDTRFAKIIWCSYETSVSCIEIAAQFAEEVHVIVLSGNHDYHAALQLTIQLYAHFRNCEKITIDISPEKHRFYTWGNTVFMATHGDVNEKRIAPYAMQQVIRRGLARDVDVERVMVRMGHLHKRGRKTPDMLSEEDGVIVERFPTLAAQEAYSIEGAYTSCRATSANLWHHTHGRYGGREITLGEILEMYPL
jgi:ribosomal protein L31